MNKFKNFTYLKIKFYIDRKSGRFVLTLLTLFSVFTIFKTSSEPILGFLIGSCVEKYLYRFSTGNDIVFNLANSFIVSVIFYLIVVYIPEKQKKKDMDPIIEKMCEELISTSSNLIKELIKESGLNYQYKTLTKEELTEVCKKINPMIGEYKFYSAEIGIIKGNLGYSIFINWSRVNRKIDDILLFLPYVDSGLLKEIYTLQNHFLKDASRDLVNSNIPNFKSWVPSFYEFYTFIKNLRDYYKIYSKNTFKNDPWK